MGERPTGTVTFLFTDIEGSTRLWEERPTEMRAALTEHDEIVRTAIESLGGYVFATGGDGFAAAFPRAADAVSAADAVQRALDGHRMLRVRIGVHTGEVQERDGDYFGPAVNRAARIMAAGHGGQVLVSDATAAIIGVDALTDLGSHRLRDLSGPQRVFQLGRSEFPRLRSLDAHRTNLPPQMTSFVGRDEELAGIADELHANRLVTITGVGGVGKTRLALQTAAEVVAQFPDGVFLVELAPLSDPAMLGDAVLDALGVQRAPGVSAADTVLRWSADRQMLLVLDNCEHVLDPVGSLAADLLRAAPAVRVLCTSREGLGLSGERIRALRSLGLPPEGAGADDALLAPSVQLFVDRAREVAHGFALTAANVDGVVQICRRLDGIPLAIELAAARVQSMAPSDIARRLDQRFRLLSAGRRTVVERHQTLRATVDWSYDLLAPEERLVLDRLSVFVGGFTLEAAEAVVAGDGVDEFDVAVLLDRLVRASLVGLEQRETDARYRLLETIRQYASEHLDDAAVERLRRRHVEWYAGFVDRLAAGLRGRDEGLWRGRGEDELDNLSTAIAWCLDAGDADGASRLLGPKNWSPLWSYRGSQILGRLAARLVDMPGARGHERWPEVLVVAAVGALGERNYERARALADEAHAASVAQRGVGGLALGAVAYVATLTGRAEEAVAAAETMHTEAMAADDAYEQALSLNMAASFHYAAGRRDVERARRALDIAKVIGNPSLRAQGHWLVGMALELIDPEEAADHFRTVMQFSARGETVRWVGPLAAAHLARLPTGASTPLDAFDLMVQSLNESRDGGDEMGQQLVLDMAAQFFAETGRAEPAALLHGALHDLTYRQNAATVDIHVRLRRAAIDALGAARFDALVAEGRQLDLNAAVKLAIKELREIVGADL